MQKVTVNDIVGLERYERIRDQVRHNVIALKNLQRVGVGNSITFVFENQETVKFQIQEMVSTQA